VRFNNYMSLGSGNPPGTPGSDFPGHAYPREQPGLPDYARALGPSRPAALRPPAASEPTPPGPLPGEQDSSKTLAKAELSALIEETFTAIIKHCLETVAYAHGLGPVVRGAELAWNTVEWLQVAEGHRGLDIGGSIPVSSGAEFDLSGHVGHSPSASEPLITACFAPASGPDPGVLVVDGCQISPGSTRKDGPTRGIGKAAHQQPEVLINIHLSLLMSRERDAAIRAAALMALAKDELTPTLRKNQHLQEDLEPAGVEYVVCYDHEAKVSVWLFFGDSGKRASSSAKIRFDTAGRLILPTHI
jgi:hypothetical protein